MPRSRSRNDDVAVIIRLAVAIGVLVGGLFILCCASKVWIDRYSREMLAVWGWRRFTDGRDRRGLDVTASP